MTRIARFMIAALMLGVLIPAGHAAESTEMSVKAELDRASMTIGDPVEYTVTIRHSPDVKVLSAIPYPPKDLFKIKHIDEFSDQEGETLITGKKFTLTTFKLGEYIMKPVSVEYRVGGGEVQKIETNPIFLTVKSIMKKGEEAQDIRGIKSVLTIPRRMMGWMILIVVILLAVSAPFLYRWLRTRAKRLAEPARILSPEEEARLGLDQLMDSGLIREGKFKQYYLRFSEILRVYLEKRYGILAVESTTTEISRALKSRELGGGLRSKIREVLEAADLAKFAKWRPEPAEIVTLHKQAREIVEESTPQPASSAEVSDGV